MHPWEGFTLDGLWRYTLGSPVRKLAWILAVILGLVVGLGGIAWWEGWVFATWGVRHAELAAQLRDRGTVGIAGRTILSMRSVETPLAPVARYPALTSALAGTEVPRVAEAVRASRLDGLLVRTDESLGMPRSALRALADMHPVDGMTAVCLDDAAALYEPAETVEISLDDARRLITVVRLVLSGATAPPERLFPESIRRTRPVEVALIVRDGHEPIIWRSTRAGSIARALLDVTFAVLDRWSTRQQERYGRLREALGTKSLTVAVFYDKGVLGSRTPGFLRRAADPRVYSVGYERLASWEYALPPTPWQPAPDPVTALTALARDRGVAPPGYLRPEITLYRFRALQIMEDAPNGPIELYDPR